LKSAKREDRAMNGQSCGVVLGLLILSAIAGCASNAGPDPGEPAASAEESALTTQYYYHCDNPYLGLTPDPAEFGLVPAFLTLPAGNSPSWVAANDAVSAMNRVYATGESYGYKYSTSLYRVYEVAGPLGGTDFLTIRLADVNGVSRIYVRVSNNGKYGKNGQVTASYCTRFQ
jgi:hypothetical protein